MIDIRKVLSTQFNPKTLICEIPRIFYSLKSQDAQFEFVSSAVCVPLELKFTRNIVTRSHAVIFVTEKLEREGVKTMHYANSAKIADCSRELFAANFKFDKVELVHNPSK